MGIKIKYSCVFIGVNYCTSEETCAWAENVLSILDDKLILVMDNSAERTDSELENRLHSLSENIIYINCGNNLGYLPAADIGLQELKRKNIEFDFLFVCNVDLHFETKNIIENLNAFCDENVGVLAPSIIDARGHDLNPYGIKKPSRGKMIRRFWYFKYERLQPIVNILRLVKRGLKSFKRVNKVVAGTHMYMCYGACFIFTPNYFRDGGTLKPALFLYAEEGFIAEQCIKIQKDIVYAPSVVIRDIGHVSTGRLKKSVLNKYLLESVEYALNHYY